jgi:hypothetical protein
MQMGMEARESVYLQSLLSTDARIIAENTDHIVVAIRISKNTIRDNHPFLGALSDASASSHAAVESPYVSAIKTAVAVKGAGALLVHPATMALNWVLTFVGMFT